MDNKRTIIKWALHDYCKAQCDYCPINSRGGEKPKDINEYLDVANRLIDSYKVSQGRSIEWIFDGGEPLDLDYLAQLLKQCRASSEKITLNTSGGRLWMDWWAIEPYVDELNLTFHFWQNGSLVKYLFDLFTGKNKKINITAPIRHQHVSEDINRVLEVEDLLGIVIVKTRLYEGADRIAGLKNYSPEDLQKIDFYNLTKERREEVLIQRAKWEEERLRREREPKIEIKEPPVKAPVPEYMVKAVKEKLYYAETSWEQRHVDVYNKHPSFSGQLCNAGVEHLDIGPQGWVSGSACGNQPMGNIWNAGWSPAIGPQVCTMQSCVHPSDQLITKFPLHDQ